MDEDVPPEVVAADPFETLGQTNMVIPTGPEVFLPQRGNAIGFDLAHTPTLQAIEAARGPFRDKQWKAAPLLAAKAAPDAAIPVVNPADLEQSPGTVRNASAADVATALDHATPWDAPLATRRDVLLKAAALIEDNYGEIFALLAREAGKGLPDCVAELREGVDFLRYYAGQATNMPPAGIFTCISPWNFPMAIFVGQISAALAAGNAVVLKHSTQTPLVALRYAEAFAHAGLPEGVFQHVFLTHANTAHMVGDARVDYVAFTGSVSGGTAIQKATSSRFIGAGLELGGKDPAYVRSDANLQHSIENVIDGAFFNSGQSCCGIERIYVHEDVYDEFVEGAIRLTKQYILGNPLDEKTTLGPMVRTRSADFARQQINEAISQGAVALIPPILFPENKAGSPYLAPQILVNVTHDMRVMQEESFAPVVSIMKVDNDEQAIQLMNDSEFGLTASIWTEDLDRAVSIGNQINTGTWYMNRCDYLDPELAWTGVKNSGRGCTLSVLGYNSLTRPKSFHLRVL